MKTLALREKSNEELRRLADELREKASALRYDIERKKAKNVKALWAIRRDIARVLTVLKDK